MRPSSCRAPNLESSGQSGWRRILGPTATIVLLAVTLVTPTTQATEAGGKTTVYNVEGYEPPEAVVQLAIEARKRATEAGTRVGGAPEDSSPPQPPAELLPRPGTDSEAKCETLRERLRRGLEAQRQLQMQLQESLTAYEEQRQRVRQHLQQQLVEMQQRWEQVFQIVDQHEVIEGPARERLQDLLRILRQGPSLRSNP